MLRIEERFEENSSIKFINMKLNTYVVRYVCMCRMDWVNFNSLPDDIKESERLFHSVWTRDPRLYHRFGRQIDFINYGV